MIVRLIELSARNRGLVIVVTTFLVLVGWWSLRQVPLDALPDLSDTQVIVFSRWDRSPDQVEAQVTYPIVTALAGAPGVRAVRGISDFGYSFVYVIFDDATDLYWARSRVQEYLAPVLAELPPDARSQLGPDASGIGWVFQYAVVDRTGRHSLADLRRVQDFYLRYHLRSVPGVAEVAAVGGFEKQYQIHPDPLRLQAWGIPIQAVVEAVRAGNVETGGRLLELGGTEYMIRGRGYASTVEEFEQLVVGMSGDTPIRVRDIGRVELGPAMRRGVADLDGGGDVVSGIVVMRDGQNALEVIERVRTRLAQLEPGLPEGVSIVPIYDRSGLIRDAVANLRARLIEIVVVTSLVIFLFLRHGPSAVIPVITIPVAVLLSFIPFRALGLTANIMSLGGIALAVGTLADGAIVIVEQTHKRLEEWEARGRPGDSREVVLSAIRQVAAPSFFSLLVIAVSFLPILVLEAQEGRLFTPLAYTKTLSMLVAAILVLTVDPALRVLLTRFEPYVFRPRWLASAANALLVGRIHAEERQGVSRLLRRLYGPAATWCLDHKAVVLVVALLLMAATVPAYLQLGSEFMPPLDEGTLFYMPTTMPGISLTESQRLLQITDTILAGFPEVDRVLGKAGRAETSTDPAPLSMLETVVTLKPKSEWRTVLTWYSDWAPGWLLPLLRRVTPDHISTERLIEEMDDALRLPGLSNAFTMPIKARTDMLSTGIRTPVGLKVSGADLDEIERIATAAERHLRDIPGTRSVFAERTGQGFFLDIRWRREELARYGLSLAEAQEVVQTAIGGEVATRTVEGLERYSVIVRYPADFRSDPAALERVLVAAGPERQLPLGQLADIELTTGPAMIRNEDGLLTGYVYVDLDDRDPASWIAEADAVLRARLPLPAGYALVWSGQYEAMARVRERLALIVPVTLALIVLLLYLNTRSLAKTSIVLLAVPFSAIGAVWLLWALDYNLSIAVWVGLIALLGVDAETGVFMLLYLDLAWEEACRQGRLAGAADLRRAVYEGAVTRLRPKFMTAATVLVGLLPILLSSGVGSDVMKRIAAPMLGGIVTSFLLELLVYPVIYEWWKGRELRGAVPPGWRDPCRGSRAVVSVVYPVSDPIGGRTVDRKKEGVNLEEAFFADQNARLLEQLRKKAEHEQQRQMLRRVVAIDDDAFLDRLIALGIGPERAMVLRLTPLVFVAWADGSVDAREREAILDAAAREGIASEAIAAEVLGDWLERRPHPRILEMWKDYIRKVWDCFTPDEQLQMRNRLLSATHEVARAAGGFLGVKSISAAEQKVLDDLESVLR